MATVVSGAKMQPMPIPATISGGRKEYQTELGVAIQAAHPIPIANSVRPVIRMYFPPMRSASRPANGAMNTEMIDAGASVRPAAAPTFRARTAGRS